MNTVLSEQIHLDFDAFASNKNNLINTNNPILHLGMFTTLMMTPFIL